MFFAVFFVAVRPAASVAGEHAGKEPHNIDSFIARVPGWVERLKTGGRPGAYSYLPGKKRPDLYGSTDVFYLLYTLDMLDLNDKQRESWAEIIRKFQNKKSGWFIDYSTTHSKEHATAYAVGALKLLGFKPKYPLSFIGKFDTPEKIEKMLEEIPWGNVWSGSHIASGIASAPINTGEIDDAWLDTYFNWLDREVDPRTGYWIRGGSREKPAPTMHELGGAFHFYYIYTYLGRPLPYPEKIIDTTIAIQRENGLWDADVPYCIDLDGVFSIIHAYRQTDGYRSGDVNAAVEKTLTAIVERLNDPEFVSDHYVDSHKLVGAVVALAEIQAFLPNHLKTPRPLKCILAVSPFI
ncbi:MAG: hypothetical protein ABIH66_08425 [bacterium]